MLGIGVGDYVLSPTIMAEHANRADRGRLGLGFGTMWPVGALAAALLTLALDGLGIAGDLQMAPRACRGRGAGARRALFPPPHAETARYLARLAGDSEAVACHRRYRPSRDRAGRGWAAPRRRVAAHGRAILSAALLWMIYDLVVYAAILFGPSLIASSMGLGPVSFSLLIQIVFVLPASVLMSVFLLDRVGRKPLQV